MHLLSLVSGKRIGTKYGISCCTVRIRQKKRSYTVPTGDMKMTNMGHSNEPGAHFRTEQSYMVVMLASQLGIYFRASLGIRNRGIPLFSTGWKLTRAGRITSLFGSPSDGRSDRIREFSLGRAVLTSRVVVVHPPPRPGASSSRRCRIPPCPRPCLGAATVLAPRRLLFFLISVASLATATTSV